MIKAPFSIWKRGLFYLMENSRSAVLSVDNSQRCHVDDIVDIIAALQHMNRFIHAHQDRAYCFGLTKMMEEFIADIA